MTDEDPTGKLEDPATEPSDDNRNKEKKVNVKTEGKRQEAAQGDGGEDETGPKEAGWDFKASSKIAESLTVVGGPLIEVTDKNFSTINLLRPKSQGKSGVSVKELTEKLTGLHLFPDSNASRLLVVSGEHQSGRWTAAVQAAMRFIDTVPEGHKIPSSSGIYETNRRINLNVVLDAVRTLAMSETSHVSVVLIRHSIEELVVEGNWRVLTDLISGSNLILIAFSPKTVVIGPESYHWNPVFNFRDVVKTRIEVGADLLDSDLVSQIEKLPIGRQVHLALLWRLENFDLEFLKSESNATRELIADQLLSKTDSNASTRMWVITACLLNDAEFDAVDEGARVMAEIQNSTYNSSDLIISHVRRLGRRQEAKTDLPVPCSTGQISDEVLVETIVNHFRAVAPSDYTTFLIRLGQAGGPLTVAKVVDRAVRLSLVDSKYIAQFLAAWGESECLAGGLFAAAVSDNQYGNSVVKEWVIEILTTHALSLIAVTNVMVALSRGALAKERSELVDWMIRDRNLRFFYLLWLVAFDSSGKYAIEFLRICNNDIQLKKYAIEKHPTSDDLLDLTISLVRSFIDFCAFQAEEPLTNDLAMYHYANTWIKLLANDDLANRSRLPYLFNMIQRISLHVDLDSNIVPMALAVPLYVLDAVPSDRYEKTTLVSEILTGPSSSDLSKDNQSKLKRAASKLMNNKIIFWKRYRKIKRNNMPIVPSGTSPEKMK